MRDGQNEFQEFIESRFCTPIHCDKALNCDMGVSENSVPLNPMVLLIIIPFLNGYFIGNINPTFSDKPIWVVNPLEIPSRSQVAQDLHPIMEREAAK